MLASKVAFKSVRKKSALQMFCEEGNAFSMSVRPQGHTAHFDE